MKTTISRRRFTLLAAIGLLALLAETIGDRGWGREPVAAAFDKIHFGMTPEQVRQQVGPPRRIARQILYHRHVEQWIYDKPIAVRLQFDCVRGQKARLIGKHVRR